MSFIKNNKATILLLSGLILGGIIGLVFGEKATILEPIGKLFVNFMYMILVPLVFFSVSSAIADMSSGKRLGKIMLFTLIVFSFTAIISAIIGYVGLISFPIIKTGDIDLTSITEAVGAIEKESVSITDRVVSMLSVSDFSELLSKNNMIPVIIMSVLVGLSTSKTKNENDTFKNFLTAGNKMILKVVDFIMIFAPIGLGAYFASIIGSLGDQIIGGYTKVFVLYCVLTLIYFFGVMTLYAFISGGKKNVRLFWANITTPALTALATCSSAASIPVNIEYTKKMNVDADIAETVIPLGANTHKDGSVIGGVLKIGFLFLLYGRDIFSIESMLMIIGGGFFVGLIMGSIPGGGMVAETLIVSMFGFPLEAIPLVLIISTIIDMPATLLNSSGNTVSAMMVQKLVNKFDTTQ